MRKQEWKKLNREERGLLIYKTLKITKTEKGWSVPSQVGKGTYLVTFRLQYPKCTCPDSKLTHSKCKHIYAVEFFIKDVINKEGKIRRTKGVRVQYGQNWKAYDKSQTNELFTFMKLLNDLCNQIEEPKYKFGRPKLSTKDLMFCSALKVYSTFSLRRFMSYAKIAHEMKLITSVPCYASVGHFLQKPQTTKLVKKLIHLSSYPLRGVEKDFAIDSSGFSSSKFARYLTYRHHNNNEYRYWLKAHVMSGVKTNIVTSVNITDKRHADSPQLSRLVDETSKMFRLGGVSCDKAYSSKKNLEKIDEKGGVPYIPFKVNAKVNTRGSPIWLKMHYFFLYKNEEFLKEYGKCSNAETVFHIIKMKFGSNLKSKSFTAQKNELYMKFLCHNICVVAHEIQELGIKGEFI